MTFSQKAVDFTARHQFSAIASCWALGIAGAFGVIMRNPCACHYFIEERIADQFFDGFAKISKFVTKGKAQLVIERDGSFISQSIWVDRASENVVAGDYDRGGYRCCGCNEESNVPPGLGRCWASCDER